MSSKCFITFLNTTAQTEHSGFIPRSLPRGLRCSHALLLRRKVVSGQIRDFDHRANLDRTFAGAWDWPGNIEHLIEIPGFNHEKSTKLFARFREWTVGDETFAVPHLDAGRRRHGL